jgi:bifunctional non-homologous end joining protein LigD
MATTRASAKDKSRPEVAGIAISHPDKVLWPKAKGSPALTKLDLARYYEAAAVRMLPHIAERPLSLVRAPDGIDGERFFQRHKLIGTAAPMLAIRVKGEREPFLGLDNAKSLVALAQAGVLEIHPWGCRKDDPDTPERVIFDLDPAPDLDFARVVAAAKELRARLAKLGFEPFVKTTGGKGLHVVVAIKGTPKNPATWADAKAFAKAVALTMEKDSPDAYTSTVAKKERVGKIFIDYLRNDRTSTGVAPWSPRARPGATIATPLAWSQLKAGLDPHAFRLDTSAALLKRADPWADLAKSARALPK